MDGVDRMTFDGYVCVSNIGLRHGERFISPRVQEDRIRTWAEMSGARMLDVFVELDESGGRADRPLLEKVIGRIEDDITQGVVVAKIDRFGRSLLDERRAIRDGGFVGRRSGVGEGFDHPVD